ncbi:MAG: sugar ABC transporter permease [Chloroflexi bacterium]|nr:sugar ABC transporter permease [Chloroflexota bacterium]
MALRERAAATPALSRPIVGSALTRLLDRESVLGPVLLLPTALILLVFVAYPFAYGVWLSLNDARVGQEWTFVGPKHFVDLIGDTIFLQTVRNTFVYTGVTTVLKLVLGLAMAVLLSQSIPLKRFVRAGMLLPFIIPTVLSTLAWLWMFDSTYSVFNWMLEGLGLKGPIWLGDGSWPMTSIIIVNVWRGVPFYAICFLAGMQVISQDLYEAAAIDGATAWQRFRHITLPLLRPVITVVLLLSTILTFADFQIVYVLTRGGPANTTHLFATYAYQVGLVAGQIGVGAAISPFMFPLLCLVVFLTLWSLRQRE